MDINNAFLYSDFDEDVYISLKGIILKMKKKMCKLIKSLYGLKQAFRKLE